MKNLKNKPLNPQIGGFVFYKRLYMKQLFLSALLCATLLVSGQTEPTPKRCTAITVKGKQCLNKAKEGDKCYIHSDKNRCEAKTQKGERCLLKAKEGQKFCFKHIGQQ